MTMAWFGNGRDLHVGEIAGDDQGGPLAPESAVWLHRERISKEAS